MRPERISKQRMLTPWADGARLCEGGGALVCALVGRHVVERYLHGMKNFFDGGAPLLGPADGCTPCRFA